jgi:tRNA-dihydrouridine synthase 3
LIDLNCGCPIDYFTHKGLGASLGRQPARQRRLIAAIKGAVSIPVTAKIRLGWNDDSRNYLEQARAIVDAGADALVVHGRTRSARYRTAADWEAIAEIADAVPIPVVGNGDILYGHDVAPAIARGRCHAVMTARGALIRPWLFREVVEGYRELSGDDRLVVYRRYASLAREHWGEDDYGLARVRTFTRWHLDFWCRDARPDEFGRFPSMQARTAGYGARNALEVLLSRSDAQALDYLADCLAWEREVRPADVPAAVVAAETRDLPMGTEEPEG